MNKLYPNDFQEIAYAKINLALHVRARLPNGYHELETVFAFVDQGDEISVIPDGSLSLSIEGRFAEGLSSQDNLVIEAAKLLREKYEVETGGVLHLRKNLPVASGIGGGSADAAATLRLLNRFWKLDLSIDILMEISKPLGADVPACVLSEASFGHGIGQDLVPLATNDLTGKPILLVNPITSIKTADIFKKWDGLDLGPLEFEHASDALIDGRNDLQPIALTLVDDIGRIVSVLKSTNPIMTKMSGSGATCFAIYETVKEMDAARDKIERNFESIWTMGGGLR